MSCASDAPSQRSFDMVSLVLCCDLWQLSRGRSSMSGSDVIAWRRKRIFDASISSIHTTPIGYD